MIDKLIVIIEGLVTLACVLGFYFYPNTPLIAIAPIMLFISCFDLYTVYFRESTYE